MPGGVPATQFPGETAPQDTPNRAPAVGGGVTYHFPEAAAPLAPAPLPRPLASTMATSATAAPATTGSHAEAEGPIVLFDGHCTFCSGVVDFLIRRDPRGVLRFAALQSPAGRRLLAEHGIPVPDEPDTMVLVDGPRALVRSSAALETTKYLRAPWPLARIGFVVPRLVRDAIYTLVARNRYRWFGRTEQCRVPTPELRARFVE